MALSSACFVHLGLGLLWSWRIGKGTADERLHLRQMLCLLPSQALVVADAAYLGYMNWPVPFSVTIGHFCCDCRPRTDSTRLTTRLSQNSRTDRSIYWPETAQKEQQPPLLCRLILIQATGQTKNDVWLLTKILDSQRLSLKTAAKFYRWRWRNEGVFRTIDRRSGVRLCGDAT